MAELVHKELSYIVVGVLFKVYNELGGGYQLSGKVLSKSYYIRI